MLFCFHVCVKFFLQNLHRGNVNHCSVAISFPIFLVLFKRKKRCTEKMNYSSYDVLCLLQKLFGLLLEYTGELATMDAPELKTIDRLVL